MAGKVSTGRKARASWRGRVAQLGLAPARATALRAWLLGTTALLPAIGAAQAQGNMVSPNARPTGGQVVAGSATIGQTATNTTINQATDRAAINWQQFNVGSQHSVTFQQPSASSWTLNRVVGSDPSLIAGRITANGGVAIVNQSGVVFAGGAQVNVGSLIASAANITNQNFMNGRMVFDGAPNPGATVENHGSITVADRGLAALVGPRVHNSGVIRARLGRAALAGAETYSLDLAGDGLLSIDVTQAVRSTPAGTTALVTNSGTIEAAGGSVLITAHAASGLVEDLVRNTGTVAARTEAGRTGQVALRAQGGGVRVEGNVSATGGAGQRGGSVAIAASGTATVARGAVVDASGGAGGGTVAIGNARTRNARVQGKVTARGTGRGARGGTVTVQARETAAVTATGTVDVSGTAGGDIRLGTTGFGRDQTMAATTVLEQGGRLVADATANGTGGTIAINSTTETRMLGAASARGGAQGGNGGFIEVSALGNISFPSLSTQVDLAAPAGRAGTLLLDPRSITIVGGDAPPPASPQGDVAGGDAPPGGNLDVRAIDIAASSANLVLEAVETITVNAAVTKPLGGDLTLRTTGTTGATPGIFVNAGITLGVDGGPAAGSLILTSATGITVAGAITVHSGSVTLAAADSLSISAPISAVAGTLRADTTGTLDVTATGSIDAGTVDLNFSSATGTDTTIQGAVRARTGTLRIATGAGDLTTSGLGTLQADAGAITLAATGNTVIGATVTAPDTATVTIGVPDTRSITTTAAVQGGNVALTANAMDLGAAVIANAADGVVTLAPTVAATAIRLGGADPADGSLYLSAAMLGRITAPTLRIGTPGGSAITLDGTLNFRDAGPGFGNVKVGTLDLLGTTATQAAGGVLNIGTVSATVSGAGGLVLDGAGNTIDAIGAVSAAAGPVTVTSLRALTVNSGGVSAGGAVSLTGASLTLTGGIGASGQDVTLTATAGGISQGATGAITAATLNASATTDIALATANDAVTGNLIGSVTANATGGGVAVFSRGALTVGSGGVTATGAVALTGTSISLEDVVSASGQAVTLRATDGGISQLAAGAITAATLDASATAGIALATASNATTGNLIGTVTANATGGGVAVFSRGALTVGSGGVIATGAVALTGTSLSLEDVVSASGQAVTLRATTGDISQLADAAIAAGTLDAGAVTGIALATANDALTGNAIDSLTASTTSGGIAVFSRSGLTVASGGVTAGAGGISLTGPSLTLTGAVSASGQTVSLDATTGSITQGTSGAVTAATLRADAATSIDLSTANDSGTGNSFAAVGATAGTGGVALFSRAAFEVDAAGAGISAGTGSTIALTGPGITVSKAIGFTAADAANLITLSADTLSATAGISAGATGTVRIAPNAANTAVEIAGTAIAGALQLSAATLGQVTASRLVIGTTGTGGVTLGGAYTSTATTLELFAGGSITQVSGATLTVANLSAIAGTGSGHSITLTEANAVGAIVDSTQAPGFGLRAGGNVALTSTATLLTVDGAVQAGTLATPAGITLRADDLELNAALKGADANLTTVTLLPHTAGTDVTLGGSAAGTFSVTDAELARIAAGTGLLRIGASGTAAGSFTAGTIDIAGDFTVRGHAAALDLRGRQVTQSGGVLDVATIIGATAAVNAVAAGGFALDRALAGAAVNRIDTVGTLGITAAASDVRLVTANGLAVLGDIAATAEAGANVLLRSAGDIQFGNGTDAVLVRAGGGDLTVLSGGAVTVSANATLRAQDESLAAGSISLIGSTLALDGTLDASAGHSIVLTATDGRLLVTGSLEARVDITAGVTGTVDGSIAGGSPAISLGSASSLVAGGNIVLGEQTALISGLTRDIDAQGSITAGGTASLAALTGSIAHAGTILAGVDAALSAAGSIGNSGTIGADANALLTAGTSISNSAGINAGANALLITGTSIGNSGGIDAGTQALLSAGTSIDNSGTIDAGTQALLSAGTSIDNSGTIDAGTQARLFAGTSIDNSGTITAGTLARLEAGLGGVSGGIALSNSISASTGDVVVLAHLGDISQTAGSLTALSAAPRGTVALVALDGDISQSGTGRIQATQLIARASGAVALENFTGGLGNVVGRLLGAGATAGLDATAFPGGDPARRGSMAGGDFRLRTTSASLTVEGLVRAGTEVDSGGTVTVQTPGQILRLLADDLVLDATTSPDGFVLRTPGGTVEIAPHTLVGATLRQVVLGGAAGSTNASALTLDSAEIGLIDTRFASGIGAGTLVIGRADSGALMVRGDVDLRDAPGTPSEYGNVRARRLVLASGGTVLQQDGTRVNVEQLAGIAGGSFVLDSANVINSVTGTATSVTAAGSSGAFSLAGIDAMGDVMLRVGGRAGTADASLAAGGTTPMLPPALDANGAPLAGTAALAINGAITTGGAGDITLRADDLAVNAALTAGATRRVVLQPVTSGQAILLGGGVSGAVGAEPAAGSALSLTQAELAQVSAGLLRIGGLGSLDARAASTGLVVQGQQAIDLTGRATTLEVLSAHGFEQRGALLAGRPGAGLTVANLAATIRTAERASAADLSPATVWLGADNRIGRIGDTTGLATPGGAGIRLTIDRAVSNGVLPSNVVTIRQAAGQSLLVAHDGIALNAAGGRVTLIADRLLDFTGTVTVSDGTIELLPRTAGQNLRLGTAGVAADGEISTATLAQLSTGGGVLRIGRSIDAAVAGSATYAPIGGGDATPAGAAGEDNSRLAGSITLAGDLLLRGVAQQLELYAGTATGTNNGSITQAAGTRLDVLRIAGASRFATSLDSAANTIDTLAPRSVLGTADTGIAFASGTGTSSGDATTLGNFALRTAGALWVAGDVAATHAATGGVADLALTSAGTLRVASGRLLRSGRNAALTSTAGRILLESAARLQATGGAAILSATGPIALGTDVVVLAGNGNATLTAGGSVFIGTGAQVIASATGANTLVTTTTGDITVAATGSIAAAGDTVLLAGNAITVDGAVIAGGNAGLTATAGVIGVSTGGSVQSLAGNVTLSGGTGITNSGTIRAIDGSASLTAVTGGIVSNPGAVLAATLDATLTAAGTGGAITLATLTAGQDAGLTARGAISLGSLAATRHATLTSTFGDIILGGGASVTAANGTATLTATAGAISAAGSATVTAGTDAILVAGTTIGLGTVSAGHDASLTAGGTITYGSVTAAHDATLTSATGDVVGNGGASVVATGGTATLRAIAGNIHLNPGAGVLGGAVALTAAGGITLDGSHILQATTGNLTLSATGGSLSIGDNVTLQATTGSIALASGTGIATGGTTTLRAGTGIALTAATGTIALGTAAELQSSAGPVSLTATAGSITLGTGTAVRATAGTATLTAGTGITAGAGLVVAGNTGVSLTATSGAIGLGDFASLQAAVGAVSVTAAGNLDLGAAASLLAGAGAATLNAGNAIRIAVGSSVTASAGALGLSAGVGGITATGAFLAAGGSATLASGGGIALGSLASVGNATLTAVQAISLGSVISSAGSASVTSSAGGVSLGDSGVIRGLGSSLLVSAAGDVTLGTSAVLAAGAGNATVTAGGGISLDALASIAATGGDTALTATTGSIAAAATAQVQATGDVTLQSALGITAGVVGAGRDARLAATQDITAVSVTGGRDARIETTGGGIALVANGLAQATAGALTVRAAGEIALGAGAAMRANAGTVSVQSTGGGIIAAADAVLFAGLGDIGLSAGGNIAAGTRARIEALAGNAAVTAGGNVSLGDAAVLRASGAVTATGGTGLAIGNGATVQAATGVGLTATTGALGIGTGTGIRATAGGVTAQARAGSITIGDGALIGAGQGHAVLSASQSITSGGLIDAAGAGASVTLTAAGGAITLLGSTTADSGSIRATTDITAIAATGIAITGEQPETGSGFTSGILQAARGGAGNITLATAAGDIVQAGGLISTRGSNAANTLNLVASTGAVRQVAASGAAIDTSRLTGQAGAAVELLAFSGGRDGAARGNRVDTLLGITAGGALQIQTVEAPTLITGPLQAGGALQVWSERALTITDATIHSTGTSVASAIGQGFNLDQLDTNARAGLVTLYSGGAITATNLVLNAEAASIRAGVPMLWDAAFGARPTGLMLDGVAATIGSAINFAAAGNITAGAPVTVTARGTSLPAAIFDSRTPVVPALATRLTLLETPLGQVAPDVAGVLPKQQATKVRNNLLPGSFGPASAEPAGDIAVNLVMLARDGVPLQNQGAAFLLVAGGNITGSIDAGRLGVVGSGGSMTLEGRLNGQIGANAAQFADISQVIPATTLQRYRINGCVVTSINCVVPPAIQIVPPRHVDRANLVIEAGRLNTAEIIIPNVSDEDDE